LGLRKLFIKIFAVGSSNSLKKKIIDLRR